jgi:multisite-specific tRNA:(cytosine-C5)-methyltransferase
VSVPVPLLACILIEFDRERLNLTTLFPSQNVLVRNPAGEPARSLYITNDIVKRVLLHNDYQRIRLISCGTKVFVKQEGSKGSEAQFRTLGEGLPVVLPYMKRDSILEGGILTLRTLIGSLHPTTTAFEQPFRSTIEDKRE